ncbi:MAG TPA: bifunctional ornithine acetyltransferase/N-acetylglutamate synthase, partial [Terricaulis sp.]|nr:bifunctional ornithine acetyltransferase/N-acetylglutamate synthase [Terricaulis sp.]
DAACKRALTEAGAAIAVEPREMLAASTGVIGVVLDDAKITRELPNLNLAPVKWHDAASAIMTTDTFPKGAGASCEI